MHVAFERVRRKTSPAKKSRDLKIALQETNLRRCIHKSKRYSNSLRLAAAGRRVGNSFSPNADSGT